jgi:hypothetical protein
MKIFSLISLAGSMMAFQTHAVEVPPFIRNMSGCFLVTYRFVEDGTHDEYIGETPERVDLSEDNGVYSLQRYGIVENDLMKHFREDWSSVANEKGNILWTQKVYSPNGSFRYECSSSLTFNQFHCETKNAPKPRRDRNRSDYTTMDRSHKIQVTPLGYVQAENNLKIASDGKVVSSEVGWIEYKRVEASKCELQIKPQP